MGTKREYPTVTTTRKRMLETTELRALQLLLKILIDEARVKGMNQEWHGESRSRRFDGRDQDHYGRQLERTTNVEISELSDREIGPEETLNIFAKFLISELTSLPSTDETFAFAERLAQQFMEIADKIRKSF
jgi:hypothetical protein